MHRVHNIRDDSLRYHYALKEENTFRYATAVLSFDLRLSFWRRITSISHHTVRTFWIRWSQLPLWLPRNRKRRVKRIDSASMLENFGEIIDFLAETRVGRV